MAKANSIEPFPSDIDRNAFGHWLSGFVDGEGSFFLKTINCRTKGRPIIHAEFRVALRDDDTAILRLIRSYLGCGRLNFSSNARSNIKNAKPVAMLSVCPVIRLVEHVIPHFEQFPLRAKKQNDFTIWKKAVYLLNEVKLTKMKRIGGQRGGFLPNWTPEVLSMFAALKTELQESRKYVSMNEWLMPPLSS